ncbi:Satratoxin biosynthesis SC13 cluster protein [Paramyrothecium foliicola]|nr:Satratoxin biosynthesis SC13 cluster protein [Paramyrothecium foliicola]
MAPLISSAHWNFRACTVMLALTVTSVALRFAVRKYFHDRILGADWMCLVALVFFVGYCGAIIGYIFGVSDFFALEPDENFGLKEMGNIMKLLYALELLFGCVITAAKLSILWLYHTIFAVDQVFRRIIYVTAGICILWFVITTLVLIFQCNPVRVLWTEPIQDIKCIKPQGLLLGYELTNFFLDVLVLCLPIWVIRKLKLPTTKKISIVVIFLLGSL